MTAQFTRKDKIPLDWIRDWIEESYKQIKDELGWADFQVRSDTAFRRHQALVTCAFLGWCPAGWCSRSWSGRVGGVR